MIRFRELICWNDKFLLLLSSYVLRDSFNHRQLSNLNNKNKTEKKLFEENSRPEIFFRRLKKNQEKRNVTKKWNETKNSFLEGKSKKEKKKQRYEGILLIFPLNYLLMRASLNPFLANEETFYSDEFLGDLKKSDWKKTELLLIPKINNSH